MKNAIRKLVKKKAGLKFSSIVLEMKKAEEDVTEKEIRKLITELAAEKEVIVIDYRLEGADRPGMFVLPANTEIMSEDVEEETILPEEMFTGFAVFTTEGSTRTMVPAEAQATALEHLAKQKQPEVFGLIPLKITSTLAYVAPQLPSVVPAPLSTVQAAQ